MSLTPQAVSEAHASISSDSLRALYQNSLDGLLLTSPTGDILSANPAACALLGYTEEEICQLGRGGIVDLSDPRLPPMLEERRRTGRMRGEVALLHRDGRRIPVEVSSVIFREASGADRTSMVIRDLSAREEARRGEQRARLLAEITTVLTGTLDPDDALTRLAAIAAREIADYCVTYLLAEDGTIRRVGISHADPARAAEVRAMLDEVPVRLDDPPGRVGAVVRTGEPMVHFEIGEEVLTRYARDDLQLQRLLAVGPVSSLVVPLRARGQTLGALTLATVRGGRPPYSADDLLLAQELADRAALAVDNARLYARATAELEQRRRLDAALRDEEERFGATFEQAAVGLAHGGLDGRCLRVNARLCEILGYTREELLALTFADVTHPEDLHADQDGFRSMLDGAIDSWRGEKRYIRKDGQVVWAHLTVSPVRSAAGDAQYLIAVVEDISRRKQAEAELRESEAFNRRLLESSGDCLKVLDLDGRLLYMNHAGQQLMRIPQLAPLLGTSWIEFWQGEHREAAIAAVQAARSGGDGRFQGRCSGGDGTALWWDVVITPVPGADGMPYRLLAISRDITGKREADDRLAKHEELLREAEAMAQLGSWEWEIESGVITWSDQLFRLFGLEPGSTSLDFQRFLERVHPEDRELVHASITGALATGEPFAMDHRVVWPDGAVRTLHGRGRVIRDVQGRPERMRGSSQDITERRLAEDEMRRARDAAEAASRAKSQFLATMSHELRTPLSGIIGYADLLGSGIWGVVNEQQGAQLARIKSAAWHLVSVIEEILSFSRLEAGKEELRREVVDLAAIVRESAELIEPQLRAKGLQLRMVLPDAPLPAEADPGKLRQILLNLLGNAAKFTDVGHIEVRLETDGDQVRFRVRDTGPGIPADQRESIFEPFRQLDQSHTRAKEGTGLGLTVCRRLARLMGGDVVVEETPGPGSTLALQLPLAPGGGAA